MQGAREIAPACGLGCLPAREPWAARSGCPCQNTLALLHPCGRFQSSNPDLRLRGLHREMRSKSFLTPIQLHLHQTVDWTVMHLFESAVINLLSTPPWAPDTTGERQNPQGWNCRVNYGLGVGGWKMRFSAKHQGAKG